MTFSFAKYGYIAGITVVAWPLCNVLSSAMQSQCDDRQTESQKRRRTTELIEALANRNPSPRLMKSFGGARPLFPAEYDWDEQSRIRKAFAALASKGSAEGWEELLRHSDDDRYCLTMMQNGAFNYPTNRSVGDICEIVARWQLTGVAKDQLAKLRPGFAGQINLGKPLSEWRSARTDKELYQLQIEVCEMALQKARGASNVVSEERRGEVCVALEAEIKILKDTEQPIFKRFPMGYYEFYNSESAEEIRNKLEKEK